MAIKLIDITFLHKTFFIHLCILARKGPDKCYWFQSWRSCFHAMFSCLHSACCRQVSRRCHTPSPLRGSEHNIHQHFGTIYSLNTTLGLLLWWLLLWRHVTKLCCVSYILFSWSEYICSYSVKQGVCYPCQIVISQYLI